MQIFNQPLDFSFDLGQMVTWYNFSRKQIGFDAKSHRMTAPLKVRQKRTGSWQDSLKHWHQKVLANLIKFCCNQIKVGLWYVWHYLTNSHIYLFNGTLNNLVKKCYSFCLQYHWFNQYDNIPFFYFLYLYYRFYHQNSSDNRKTGSLKKMTLINCDLSRLQFTFRLL